MFAPDCKTCLNSRLVVSENKYDYECCLSGIKALRCYGGDKSFYEGNGKDIDDLKKLKERMYESKERLVELLEEAVDALADMVNQFGYSTTFRKQDAVCDGGLSALENAFGVLEDCGYKINSNGSINRKNLWKHISQEKKQKRS